MMKALAAESLSNTVLVVDDTPANLRLAAEYLEHDGLNVTVARDGEEAISRAEFVRPDLILLDLVMPGIDGFETCRRLKTIDAFRDTPVIFMTALTDVQDKVKAFAAGGVDYVVKPFHAEELLARVKTHLLLRTAQRKAEQAEREAKEAHARLLDAFEVVPEGLALFDAEDRYVLWNRRYAQVYAMSGDRIEKGMRFEDVLRAGLARGQYPVAIGREEQWLAQRLAWHTELRSAHEQRLPEDRWVRIEEQRTSDGGSIGVQIDITDLKLREESLRLLFDGNPIPMWVYDRADLRILAVNDAAIDHYGYSRKKFLSMSILDIRPKEDWAAVRAFAAIGGSRKRGERLWRHIKADGTRVDVSIYSRRLRYQGRDASMVAAIDVTERKRAEEELNNVREFLNTIIENVPTPILVKDARSFRYILLNRAAERLFGVPRDYFIGKTAKDMYPKEDAATISSLLQHADSISLVSDRWKRRETENAMLP